MSVNRQLFRQRQTISHSAAKAIAPTRLAIACTLIAGGLAHADVATNLATHFRLDETDAGNFTVLNSAAGAAENGIRTNGFLINEPGKVGTAYSHGATTDNILIGTAIADQLMASDQFTLTAWVNPSFYRPNQNAASRHTLIGANTSLTLSLYGQGNIFLNYRGSAGTDDGTNSLGAANLANGLIAPLNQWSHIAATRNGSNVSLYINGILVGQKSNGSTGNTLITTFDHDGNAGTPNDAALFGGHVFPTATSAREFQGRMDELGIWAGKALSHQEIAAVAGLSGLTNNVDLGSNSIDAVLNVFNSQTGTAAAGGQNWSYTDSVPGPQDGSTLYLGKHYTGSDGNFYIVLDGTTGFFTGVTNAAVPSVGLATWDGGGNGAWSGGPNWVGDSAPGFTVGSPSILVFNSAGQTVNNDVANAVVAGLRFDATAGAFTFTGNGFTVIPGASRFIKNDSTAQQTFSNSGTIILGGAGMHANAGPIVVNAAIDAGSAGATTFRANAPITLNGKLSGSSLIQKRDAGTLTLTNAANDFSGPLTVLDGVVAVSSGGALGSPSGTITTAGGATTAQLRLNGSMSVDKPWSIGAKTGTVLAHSPSIVSNGNVTLGGAIQLTSGGTLGAIQSDAGNLTLAGGVSAATTGVTLLLEGAGDGAVTGAISNGGGSIALVKAGAGSWTLSGPKSYTGNTEVQAGTLKIVGTPIFSSNANKTTTTVAAGATLDLTSIANYELQIGQTLRGKGTVRAATLVAYDDNNIKPGDDSTGTIGTLAVQGNLSLLNQFAPPVAGGNLTFELNNTTTVGGGVNDLIDVTGDLTTNSSAGAILVNVTPTGGFLATGNYQLIKYTGAKNGSASYSVVLPQAAADYRATPTVDESAAGHVDLVVPAGISAEITWSGDDSANVWDANGANNFNAGAEKFFHMDRVTFDDSSPNRTVNITESVFPGSVTVTGSQDLTWVGNGSATFSGTGKLLKTGTNNLTMTNTTVGTFNTAFTGAVEIAGGTLSVVHIGQLSQGGTPDRLVLNGGALAFVGPTTSNTARQFALGTGGGTFSSLGSGTWQFSNTGTMGFTGSGPRLLGLNGTFSGVNAITLQIGDGPGGATSVVKTGPTGWSLPNTANNFTGGVTVNDGTLIVSRLAGGPVAINGGRLRFTAKGVNNDPTATSVVTSITSSGGAATPTGLLDVANNSVVVDYSGASPVNEIRQLLLAGFNTGTVGIISTSAASGTGLGYADNATLNLATFGGVTVDSSSVLIKFTRIGDANLNGTTEIGDFSLLAANFNQPSLWNKGDFNYDGVTNISDFALLAANFNQSVATGSRTSVPEPAAIGVLAVGSLAMMRRRRAC